MPLISNLVQQNTLSVGTGDMTLAPQNGRQSFYAAFGSGGTDMFFYFISHQTAAEWEAGTGHLSNAATLVRDTVISSSNSNARVSFSAGAKDVVNDIDASRQLVLPVSPAAGDIIYHNGSGWTRLARGGNGQFLVSGASSVSWAAPAGGSDRQLQYNNSSALGGASKVKIDAGGNINIGEYSSADPAAPADGMTLFTRLRAGSRTLSVIGPLGIVSELQVNLGTKKFFGHFATGGGSSTISQVGQTTLSATGTATSVAFSGASYLGSFHRLSYVSASSAGSSCGGASNNRVARGSASGAGGFKVIHRVVIETPVPAAAVWFGCAASTSDIGDVDPSSLLNICGFGADTGDANMQWMVNDGTGTATKVDLGANFPAKTAGAVYEARIWCKPNDSVIYYSIQRLDVPQFAEGSSSADLPGGSTALAWQFHMGNRGTASPVTISFQSMTCEVTQ